MQGAAGLISLAGLWLATVASPGPNFVRISHATLTWSHRTGAVMALGTACGNALWCLAAACGFAAIAQTNLATVLKWGGAVYLGWCAYKLLRNALLDRGPNIAVSPLPPSSPFNQGLMTALSNPQAVVFFGTLFLACFPGGLNVSVSAASVAIVFGVTVGWYAVVIGCLAAPQARRVYLRFKRGLDICLAGVLAAMALKVGLSAG